MRENKKLCPIPYIILGVIMFFFFSCANSNLHDDTYFKQFSTHNISDLISFSKYRYYVWTSRNIIETIELLLLACPIEVWRFLSSLAVVGISYSFKLLLGIKDNVKQNVILCMLVATFPLAYYASSGWITATSVYLLPSVSVAITIIPIGKLCRKEIIHWYEIIIYIISSILACNNEQTCAIIFGVYSCSILYFLITHIKIHIIQPIIEVISIVSVLYILTCPGNNLRVISEIEIWNPDYTSWSFFDKLVKGITNAVDGLFFMKNIEISFVGILFLLTLLVHFTVKSKYKRIINISYLFIYCFLLALFLLTKIRLIPEEFVISWGIYGQNSIGSIIDYVRVLFAISYAIFMSIQLYWIVGKQPCLFWILITWLCAFSSSSILGFSPTIYSSGIRIHTFTIYALMLLTIMTIRTTWAKLNKKQINILVVTATIILLLSTGKNIAYIIKPELFMSI